MPETMFYRADLEHIKFFVRKYPEISQKPDFFKRFFCINPKMQVNGIESDEKEDFFIKKIYMTPNENVLS